MTKYITFPTIELVHFNRTISTDDALCELDRMNMYPCDIEKLIAYMEIYPDTLVPLQVNSYYTRQLKTLITQ